MNDAHLHLLFNHLPIIFPITGLIIMIGGFIFKSEIIKRVALSIFIMGALATMPAFFTGEGAEEIVENMAGIDEKFIHNHEEIAETFAILSYLLGGLSIVALWASIKEKAFSSMVTYAVVGFSLVVIFFAQQTGTTGGEIHHLEIRKGATLPAGNGEVGGESEEHED